MKKILVLNGPNINMLGVREKNIYGQQDYAALCEYIGQEAAALNVEVEVRQSNFEGELVTLIQQAYGKFDAIVIDRCGIDALQCSFAGCYKSSGFADDRSASEPMFHAQGRISAWVGNGCCLPSGQICGLGFQGLCFSALRALAEKG